MRAQYSLIVWSGCRLLPAIIGFTLTPLHRGAKKDTLTSYHTAGMYSMWCYHSNIIFIVVIYVCHNQHNWSHHFSSQIQAWLTLLKVNMWHQIWLVTVDYLKCVWMLCLRACGGSCPLQCVLGRRETKEQKECWTAASGGSEQHSCI